MKSLFRFAFLSLLSCLMFACGGRDNSEAGRAAECYYRYLIDGKYADFVGGIAYSDSMPESYRGQMVDLVSQYAVRERELRGGLSDVKVLRDTVSGDVGNVFLEVVFGDSTREEISVPMVKCGKEWKMQ